MNSERIRTLLVELDKELKSTGEIDDETRALLSQLNDDLDEIAAGSSAGDRAKELESRFAATHPVAERITREIADILTAGAQVRIRHGFESARQFVDGQRSGTIEMQIAVGRVDEHVRGCVAHITG